MSDYWRLAKKMLDYPGALATALVMALVSAAGMGIGCATIVWILKLLLDTAEQTSLASLARELNAGGSPVKIPQGILGVLPEDPYASVILIIVSLCALTIVGATASFLHQYLSFRISARTVAGIRQEAFHHVLRLSLVRVVERGPSEYVARIVRDAGELHYGFMALVSKGVAQATRGLACFAAALVISSEVALVAVVAGVAFAVLLRKFGKRIRRGMRGSLQAQEQLLRIATESVQGLRTIKANTAEPQATRRFHRANREALRQEMRARLARALSGPLVETLATYTVALLAIVFAGRILRGSMSATDMFVALGALAAAGASFKPLAGIIHEIQAASAPAGRLWEILRDEREDGSSRRRRPALPRHRRSIEFENVTFTYPAATRPALERVSLRLAHGERVAIVGPNGSGKTTLVSILPRLLRPAEGRVLVDGVDIESVSLRSLRRQIGIVTQETVLFRGTIAENIALGTPGASRRAIEDAARRARAHDFIVELPGGYDSDLAEQGASLSGGQRQRLAIARVVLRDPAILILDEATSQIDAESDALIGAALRDFCTGRTAIVIAHRFASLLDADRIVVMEDGRIVGQGRHEDLLEQCELYGRLVRTQMIG